MNGRATLALLVAGASLAGIWWARIDAAPELPPAHPAPAAVTAATAPPRPAIGEVPAPTAAPTGSADARWLLPDGSSVPMLNGAVGAKPLQAAWPRQRPWSPIVGVRRSDAGVDWYVHADGCQSTTEMRFRSDLGRADAITRVAEPISAPPVAPTTAR